MCECSVSGCCCGCSLRTGSLAIGIVCALIDIIFLIWEIVLSINTAGGVAIGGWIGVAIYAMHLLMCIFLVWGVVQDKSGWCMIWVIGTIIFVIFEILIGLVITIAASVMTSWIDAAAGSAYAVYMTPFLVAGIFMLILAALHIYFIVVVRSFSRSIEGGMQQVYPLHT